MVCRQNTRGACTVPLKRPARDLAVYNRSMYRAAYGLIMMATASVFSGQAVASVQAVANCTHADFITLQSCEHPIAHGDGNTGQSPADCLVNVSIPCRHCMRHAGMDNHSTSLCFLDNRTLSVDACTTMELVGTTDNVWACGNVADGKCEGVLSGRCGACLVAAGVTMNSCDFWYKQCKPWDGDCVRVEACEKLGTGCGGVWSTYRGEGNNWPDGGGTPSAAMQCSRCAVGILPKTKSARAPRVAIALLPLLAVAVGCGVAKF